MPANSSPELPMTPMIDVVFLLLVFFMSSVELTSAESYLPVRLPSDMGGRGGRPADLCEPIRVRLTLLEVEPVPDLRHTRPFFSPVLTGPSRFHVRCSLDDQLVWELHQRTDISAARPRCVFRWTCGGREVDPQERLRRALRVIRDTGSEAPLLIVPDRGVPYSALVTVLAAAEDAGYGTTHHGNVQFCGRLR